MKIWVRDEGRMTLRPEHFIAQGGEGRVYLRDGKAYKIYDDPSRALPESKIAELGRIADDRVITPEVVIRKSARGATIGYRMRHVNQAEPLARLFARSFKERRALEPDHLLPLAVQLRDRFAAVHAAGALIVDASDLNFLVNRTFDEVYAIDTDSYQTPSHPATAITPSIRDPRSDVDGFGEGSDWFAFAILVFQLFTGLHPFKGRHPRVRGLAARMTQRLSAFDPEVRWPRGAWRVEVIPEPLRRWLRAVLTSDARQAPPLDFGRPTGWTLTAPARAATALDMVLIDDLGSPIRSLVTSGVTRWALAGDGIYRDGRRVSGAAPSGARLAVSPAGRAVVASLAPDGALQLFDVHNRLKLEAALRADEMMETRGRLYLKRGDKLLELVLRDVGHHVVATPQLRAQVLPHATHLFDGLAVQSLLGATYLSLFPTPGRHLQLHLRELDGKPVIAGRADGTAASLIYRDGRTLRRAVVVADEGGGYALRTESAADADPLALVCLSSGVVVRLLADERLELFPRAIGATKRRIIEDEAVGTDWHLTSSGGRVVCARGGKVYRVTVRRDEPQRRATPA